jgi:AAA+ superfamily predicted ATPase
VYSEVVKKPLYQIQSSQLGLNPVDIEKNLHAHLRRAEKLNCVLMIDECDGYVYERGADITQNAIVGVFLRMFEYYNGILFMTTNRTDKIDKAIMSRITAHVQYTTPTSENAVKIIIQLASTMGLKITNETAQQLHLKYPHLVGRDIRNLLKLLKKYYHQSKKGFTLTLDMVKPVEQFVPFINK